MKLVWLGRSAALALIAATPAVRAETLQQALIDAYDSNPDLTTQRAAVRALDEGTAIAAAGGRPYVAATVGVAEQFQSVGGFSHSNDEGRALTAVANLNVPFFSGGRVKNGIRAADRRIDAGRETLRSVENTVLVGVVTAYLDTQRDAVVVDLNRNQVKVLQEELRASNDRFQVGDLTRTDVAQSQARLANAQSNLSLAEAQLIASQENYRRVVGHAPGVLAPPPPLPPLPGTAEQAVDQAVAYNPTLGAARLEERAAALDVQVAKANRLPTLQASSGLNYINTLNSGGSSNGGTNVIPGTTTGGVSSTPIISTSNVETSTTVGISATVPLYQGGLVSAQVRQANDRRSQALEQIAVAERNAVASARNAYEGVQSSNAVIKASQTAVDANTLALEGTHQENLVGSRTILDVLNAQQELLNARVTLVRAQRDAYVAGYTLLSAIGRADADSLGLPVARYNPQDNYNRVRHVWSDWSNGPEVKPVANKTALGDQAATTTPVTTTTK